MSGLDLDIMKIAGNRTHTTFGRNKMKFYETITFHNFDCERRLTVRIQDADGHRPVFAEGDADLEIQPLSSEVRHIRPRYDGTYFKYTAQIDGTIEEDPIVIIER